MIHDPEVRCERDPPLEAQHTFPELLAALYKQKLTGRVLLHFHNGVPRIAEINFKKHWLKSMAR